MSNKLDSLTKEIAQKTGFASEDIEKLMTKPKDPKHGDICIPCFSFAKNEGKAPNTLAEELSKKLTLPNEFNSLNVIGGYINFFYNKEWFIKDTFNTLLKFTEPKFLQSDNSRKEIHQQTILVEYSAPNIAKTFHVAHLRTTLIGLSLERTFRFLGYKVVSINHLGDWGTQFGFTWAGAEVWGLPENPNVDDLVNAYIKANALKKRQELAEAKPQESDLTEEEKKLPNMAQMARDYFIRLEANEPKAREFWQYCVDISMDYFKSAYERLGIFFDEYKGESFYHPMLPRVEKEIRDSGILENSEGALGIDLGKELGFVRIFTEDGRSLYITRDFAAAFYRHETYKPARSLYVVASAQSLHFKQLVGVLKKMKHPAGDEIIHVAFGNVPGMSTRSGGAISLKKYFEESKERALEVYKTQSASRPEGINEDEIAEKVSIGATYFYFLSHSNIKDFKFSWDEALSFEGDSGPYCQYALARLHSIETKAKASGLVLDMKSSANTLSHIKLELLTDDASYELISLLADFYPTIERVAETYEPNYLAQYILVLCRTFSKHYNTLRILGNDVSKEQGEARLYLFMMVKEVLNKGLHLLGVPLIEKM